MPERGLASCAAGRKRLVCSFALPKAGYCLIDAAVEDGNSVIKRMSQRDWRLNPLQSIFFERVFLKRRRTESKRMNRRAHIMNKSRQCQFSRMKAASDLLPRLDHGRVIAGFGQFDSSRQPIGTRTDDKSRLRR